MMNEYSADLLRYEDTDNPLNPLVERIASIIKQDVDYCLCLVSEVLTNDNLAERSSLVGLIFRDFVELHDSLSILSSAKVCKPASLVVRSQFELLLAGLHLLEKSEETRANCYSLCKLLDELSVCDKVIKTVETSGGDEVGIDKVVVDIMLDWYPRAKSDKAKIQEMLNSERFSKLHKEYLRTKKKRKLRYPSWYSLNDGPASLGKLASYHDMQHLYDEVYGTYSRTAHGKDALHSIIHDGSAGRVLRLRSGLDVPLNANNAHVFCMRFADRVVEELLPNRESSHRQWRQETHENFRWLNEVRVNIENTQNQ